MFEEQPYRFWNQISFDVTCDTYNRYKEDVQLMKSLNFNSFRTSIQWTRLYNNIETSEISEDAIRFYRDYFQEMVDNGITPFVNPSHFDLPTDLSDNGGVD